MMMMMMIIIIITTYNVCTCANRNKKCEPNALNATSI